MLLKDKARHQRVRKHRPITKTALSPTLPRLGNLVLAYVSSECWPALLQPVTTVSSLFPPGVLYLLALKSPFVLLLLLPTLPRLKALPMCLLVTHLCSNFPLLLHCSLPLVLSVFLFQIFFPATDHYFCWVSLVNISEPVCPPPRVTPRLSSPPSTPWEHHHSSFVVPLFYPYSLVV